MDKFILTFFQDLETALGSPINTFCVDIGIKDPSQFEEPYNFDKMKNNIVFYEFQLPFNLTDCYRGYPKQDTQEGFSRLIPKKLYDTSQRLKLGYSVVKSLLVTGELTQRADRAKTVYEKPN